MRRKTGAASSGMWLPIVVTIVVIGVCVAIGLAIHHSTEREKEECREFGGRVVEIHRTGDPDSWMCDER